MCVIPALQDVTFHNHTKLLVKHGFISELIICNCVEVSIVLMFPTKKGGAGLAQAVQCLTTGWTTGRSGFDPRRGQRIFPLSSVSRPTLGPTQPPVQWVPGLPSPGAKRGRGVMLTTHPI
jgi:hypothetical protein